MRPYLRLYEKNYHILTTLFAQQHMLYIQDIYTSTTNSEYFATKLCSF